MLRALSGGSKRMPEGGSTAKWQNLRGHYRRMTQAVRFGDLTDAKSAYDSIRLEQAEYDELSADARLAFDALGEALDSGSLADTSDGLRLLRLVLESTGSASMRGIRTNRPTNEDAPPETLRSGVVPAFSSAASDELPETATISEIDVAQ